MTRTGGGYLANGPEGGETGGSPRLPRVLIVATKAPWPPVDGGRLLLANTLEGLAAAGCRATLVAPADPRTADLAAAAAALAGCCDPHLVTVRPAGFASSLVRARLSGEMPLSVARHAPSAVRRRVRDLVAGGEFDVLHAEQLQALPQILPPAAPTVPTVDTASSAPSWPAVVLRAQNVESDLWGATSRRAGGWRGRLLASEVRRLAGWEGWAVRRSDAVVALTPGDASRLAELAGDRSAAERIRTVAAPYPSWLPAGRTALFGDPPVVVLGSRGWLPNEESAVWFLAEVWPRVRSVLPGAVLHLFGMGEGKSEGRGETAPGLVRHPSPRDSSEAFPPRSVLVVPLRIASGVRMKILEAWARGVPVVGTPEAVAGLGARHGQELLVAQDAADFAAALHRLHTEPALVRALVAGGRAALAARHDPELAARDLLAAYRAAVAFRAAGRPASAIIG